MTRADDPTDVTEQLTLLRPRRSKRRPPPEITTQRPVARVAVDVSLPHLDRPFDYLVPDAMSEQAAPGVRVRVRFAGRLVDGFLLERLDQSEHGGRLAALHAVVSPEPVLGPEVADLARAVADRYAGSLADVLRLAVPPRHARVESEPRQPAPAPPPRPAPDRWASYDGGPALLQALYDGVPARAVWSALPGPDWAGSIADAVVTCLAGGRGALVVVPDASDVERVDAALRDRAGPGHHLALTAELGPAERYRRWLAVRRGSVRAVVGTRAAAFAPVADLALVAVWDDGDDLHAEPHAPYPHVRTVLSLRASRQRSGLIVGGFSRTVEAAGLVASGWARAVAASRATVRTRAPAIRAAGDDADLAQDPAARTARLPSVAWRTTREALEHGPVLVQVPRAGYLPSLACSGCRASAQCTRCHGPLGAGDADAPPRCGWCGVAAHDWECPRCGARRTRARQVGVTRTAEELGRAFPRHRVRTSGGDAVLSSVDPQPAIVVATPGAEPVADGGYAAALLLDGWAMLARAGLRAGEEALRRWMAAAALVRPAPLGGQVVVLADAGSPAVAALVRWDPATFADRELAERAGLSLPPAVRMAALSGEPAALARFREILALPPGAQVLGPVPQPRGRQQSSEPDPPAERFLVRVPRSQGRELADALRSAAGVRSAQKEPGAVRVQVDPAEIA